MEMDDYWITKEKGGDSKGKGSQILDDQMDGYWDAAAKAKEGSGETAMAEAAAPPQTEASAQ
jgi:hypothetical protein